MWGVINGSRDMVINMLKIFDQNDASILITVAELSYSELKQHSNQRY